MSQIQARLLKGFRDELPETMLPKQRMLNAVAETFESFGFAPLSTPALEYGEILTGKYGEEGDKLLYQFEDNGGRRVALRYDLTVPLARVMGMNKSLPLPFKRYQIAPVWRAEKPGRGRFREFMQCDVDIIGSPDLMADAECLGVGAAVLARLGVGRFVIRVNNRKLLTALMRKIGVTQDAQALAALRSVDKLPKIGEAKVRALLRDTDGLPDSAIDGLFEFLRLKPEGLSAFFADDPVGLKGAEELNTLLSLAEAQGIRERVAVDLSIARGLDYYTGTIYETFLLDLEDMGSVMSGGRYDRLLGMFGGDEVPAVGISLGVDRLFAALTELGLIQTQASPSQVLIATTDADLNAQAYALAATLRAGGVPTEVFLGAPRMKKQIKYADRRGIPLALIVGPDELAEGEVLLKILKTGEQRRIKLEALVAEINAATQPGA
ncbi:histidine--tRNA ligase [Myxococcota bacterium]|nr:histidine--tRNA ligase [Myxococcota bacterium]MBU1433073.1 histidine--tRNA ligase [Myxococcota bacterium]MBU1896502.1 histidine--tRNA ligase [Myxococcota bacterium]